jgi:methylated-DNA-protein-cysteine methyltransferase-like protein
MVKLRNETPEICSLFLNLHIVKVKKKSEKPDSFFDQVYEVVRLIPKGRITSYGAIAKYLGTSGSSRMVGWAMNGAHRQKKPVPAQRVVNRNGLLTGKHHFGSPDLMRQLLENEGVRVENDQVTEFKKLFWDPSQELLR